MASAKKIVGKGAEAHVAHYLKSVGYHILEMNFAVPRIGEIDIIARDEDSVYFIEVKARSNPDPFGGMEGCISSRKLGKVRHCADIYMQRNKMKDIYYRFIGAFVHITSQNGYEKIVLVDLD